MRRRIVHRYGDRRAPAGCAYFGDAAVVEDLGRRPRRSHTEACPATTSSRTPRRATPAGSPSRLPPITSGRGSCRWATDAAAGTASTSSTCARRARIGSSTNGRTWRSATSCRPIQVVASRSSCSTRTGRSSCTAILSTMQQPSDAERQELPAGLAASSTFLAQTPSEFKASWAFVLEPVGPNRTRLIERMRYWGGEGTPASRAGAVDARVRRVRDDAAPDGGHSVTRRAAGTRGRRCRRFRRTSPPETATPPTFPRRSWPAPVHLSGHRQSNRLGGVGRRVAILAMLLVARRLWLAGCLCGRCAVHQATDHGCPPCRFRRSAGLWATGAAGRTISLRLPSGYSVTADDEVVDPDGHAIATSGDTIVGGCADLMQDALLITEADIRRKPSS